jgi:hypothetical protein
MPAPKGNQFWKARAKHGRDRIIASAELLKEACEEYFQWVEDNPLQEAKLTTFEGKSKVEELPKLRAMTIGGLCIFLGICQETWAKWRVCGDKDFVGVTKWADEIIREQKFTGASAGLLNANIIARDLGLSERQEVTGKDGGAIITKDISDKDKSIINQYINQKSKED